MSVSKLIGLIDKVDQYVGQHSFRDIKVLAYLYQSEWDVVHFQSIIRDLNLSAVAVTRMAKVLGRAANQLLGRGGRRGMVNQLRGDRSGSGRSA